MTGKALTYSERNLLCATALETATRFGEPTIVNAGAGWRKTNKYNHLQWGRSIHYLYICAPGVRHVIIDTDPANRPILTEEMLGSIEFVEAGSAPWFGGDIHLLFVDGDHGHDISEYIRRVPIEGKVIFHGRQQEQVRNDICWQLIVEVDSVAAFVRTK